MAEDTVAKPKRTVKKTADTDAPKVAKPAKAAVTAKLKAAAKPVAPKPASKAVATAAKAEKAKPAKTAVKASTAAAAPAKADAVKPAKKPAAKAAAKPATKAAKAVKVMEKPSAPSQEERQRWIATAAYHRAEKRGFAPGYEVQDWFEAEQEINALVGKG